MQCFFVKNDASHSTICFNDRRGIAERASFGRIFHSLKGKIHGSIFVLLLGYALGLTPLQPLALADFGTSDSINLRQINEKLASPGPLFLTHTSGQLDDINASLDTLQSVFTTDGNWITGRHQAGTPVTGVVSPYSILQQLELLRRISIATTNELRRLNITNDYTYAFSNMIHSIERMSTNFIPLNTSAELIVRNLGNLADGYPLEDSDGETYDNRISATHYGNSSLTMSDALQFIAQGVGGIDTSGGPHYQNQAVIPLINTIIGWTGGFSNNNIQTNGIIGLLWQANKHLSELHTMTNHVVSAIDWQTEVISNGFARLSYLGRENAWLMTNQIYMASGYTGLPNKNNNFGAFMRAWPRSESFNGSPPSFPDEYSQPYWGGLLTLPYYTLPLEENDLKTLYADRSPYFPEQGDIEALRKAFNQYYGNMRNYTSTLGFEADDIEETKEGASNLVSEATMHTTNSVVRLVPELTVTELLRDWDDFEGVEDDWKREHGPSKEELERIKGYFDASMEESQQEVTFQFDLDFGEGTEIHTGEWNLVADDETIGGMKSAGNKFIKYGASTIKGILVCLFVWHMIEMSIAVINGDAVVG